MKTTCVHGKYFWQHCDECPPGEIQDEPMGTATITEDQAAGRAVRPCHTPGPWVVHQDGGELLVLSSSTDFDGDPDCFYICSVHGQGVDAEEQANARLIAAAPDLLKACQKMIAAFEYSGSNLVGAEYMAKESIKAAIAKVTGEQ